jgi:hypothetical protein
MKNSLLAKVSLSDVKFDIFTCPTSSVSTGSLKKIQMDV